MGTSKGNYGRVMYSNPKWKKAISIALKRKRIDIEKICPKCGNTFEIVRTINKDGSQNIIKKEKKYCSPSCSNSRIHSEETRKKIGRKGKLNKNWKGGHIKQFCKDCNKQIDYRNLSGYCVKCKSKNMFNDLSNINFKQYKQRCRFNFNLSDYPKEFNFSLIEEYGWYKAKNHGDNLNGISRDHIISVKYGFINDIKPNIIKHPGNCQLMPHSENSSKNIKCNITYEELLKKIKIWNKKYPGC